MALIGGDGGLLERAINLRVLTLAPGQRADVLLDLTAFSPGTDVHLDSLAYPEGDANRGGMMGSNAPVPNGAPLRIMTLRTRDRTGPAFRLPDRLPVYHCHSSSRGHGDDAQLPRHVTRAHPRARGSQPWADRRARKRARRCWWSRTPAKARLESPLRHYLGEPRRRPRLDAVGGGE